MKWIGQHIYDYISRFRNDVYLESVSSGTIASGGNLGLDSNNKIVKQSDTGITDLHGAGVDGAANQLLTDDGDGTITSEANLTFDGSILNLTSIMDISPANDAGAAALTIDNDDTDQIALDIIASNIDADVINIAADSVTTANVIDITCDALTTGSGLFIDDNSSIAGLSGTRSTAKIRQNNTAATAATALEVISNGATTGVLIDKNASGTAAQNCQALYVDFDRTVAGSGTSAHNDIGINLDVNSASLGTSSLKGMDIDVVGATSGTSEATGISLDVSGADKNIGVSCSYEGTSEGAGLILKNTATSSATEGGKLRLVSNDGAAMGDDHRLGIIEFRTSDGVSTITGASIEAFADAAWSDTVNDTRLEFYTMDGDASKELSLTLDSDLLATFAGAVTVTGALTGTLATASQPNITTVGTIGTGVWQGTAVASAYLDADTAHLSGSQTFTGTKTLNSFKGTGGATVTNILDEDAMDSDSATALATQQSIKAYADRKVSSDAQRQLTHHSFSDDIDTTKHYIGFTDGDTEATATTGTTVPLLAPVEGKLLKIFLRSNKNLHTLTFTWRLETQAGVNFGTGPSIVGTQSGVGCRNSTMTTYDFTTGLDSGDNLIDAGDMVYISIESDGATDTTKFYITCLWEWDLS